MKPLKNLVAVYFLAVFLLCSCATIHNGNYATQVGTSTDKRDIAKTTGNTTSLGLVISGQEVDELSSKYFTALDFTFENTTPNWIRIEKIEVSFDNETLNNKIKIPVGGDLAVWSDAAQQQQAIKEYNASQFLSAIVMVGAGAAAFSSNSSFGRAGAGLAIASGAIIGAREVNNQLNALELSKLVPASHLLSSPFVIPPGLHAKKWMLLYTEQPLEIPYASTILVKYTTTKHETETTRLSFRTSIPKYGGSAGIAPSSWQKGHKEVESSQNGR